MAVDPITMALGGGAVNLVSSLLGQGSTNKNVKNMSNMLGNAWQPMSTNTGGATAGFEDGTFSTSLTGNALDLQNQLFQQAMGGGSGQGADMFSQGQGMLTNAMNAPQVDVAAMAGQQNDLLQQLAQPGQDRDAGGLMAQLFASGKLGSTGGTGMFGELQQQQGNADLMRSSQAINMAQGAASLQNQINQGMFGQSMDMMGFGQQMTQQDFLNSIMAGQNATDMFGLSDQAGMFSMGVGDRKFAATQAQTNLMGGGGANPFAAFLGGAANSVMDRGMGMLFPSTDKKV